MCNFWPGLANEFISPMLEPHFAAAAIHRWSRTMLAYVRLCNMIKSNSGRLFSGIFVRIWFPVYCNDKRYILWFWSLRQPW